MSKKGICVRILILAAATLLNILIICYKVSPRMVEVSVEVTFESDTTNMVELFYLTDRDDRAEGYQPTKSYSENYDDSVVGSAHTFGFVVPGDVAYLRFDFGSGEEEYENKITCMQIRYGDDLIRIQPEQLLVMEVQQDVAKVSADSGMLVVNAYGEDPYLSWDVSDWGIRGLIQGGNAVHNTVIKLILCLLIDAAALACVIKFQRFMDFPKEIWYSRKLIGNLSKNDFKTKYAGSYLGIVWGFIQPIITVLVYWFVFEKGLKAGASLTQAGVEVPFVLWLVAGLVPWLFFQDALLGGTGSLVEYSYLVKKVVFKIDILPIVKVLAALYVHVFFVVFTLVLYAGYRYFPDAYTIQILYYSGAVFVLALGLSYFTSAITVFVRDITQVVNIILQIGVWITPIMWNIDTMDISPTLITILKLNPMYYIVLGYRQALIDKRWFWENPALTIYFWALTLIFFVVGFKVFRRSKVHFADVL